MNASHTAALPGLIDTYRIDRSLLKCRQSTEFLSINRNTGRGRNCFGIVGLFRIVQQQFEPNEGRTSKSNQINRKSKEPNESNESNQS
jgi:hypothetical protein